MIVLGIILTVLAGVFTTGKSLEGKKHADAILIAGTILLFATVLYAITKL